MSNPDLEIPGYSAYVRGRATLEVSFRVYGDSATFSITGSQSGNPNGYYVWIFGPGDPYECTGDDGPCAIGGSGSLMPGRYSFVIAFHKFSRIQHCEGCSGSTSGTVDANAQLSATLSVSH